MAPARSSVRSSGGSRTRSRCGCSSETSPTATRSASTRRTATSCSPRRANRSSPPDEPGSYNDPVQEDIVRKLVALLALAVVALSATALASASPRSEIMLGSNLDAMQDHATSHGKGTFTATLTGAKLSWHLSFTGLTGKATAAHIHLGPKGKAGNVLIPLCTPCNATAMGTVKLNSMQLRDLKKSATYVNVHTAKYANGEIRGQVSQH